MVLSTVQYGNDRLRKGNRQQRTSTGNGKFPFPVTSLHRLREQDSSNWRNLLSKLDLATEATKIKLQANLRALLCSNYLTCNARYKLGIPGNICAKLFSWSGLSRRWPPGVFITFGLKGTLKCGAACKLKHIFNMWRFSGSGRGMMRLS